MLHMIRGCRVPEPDALEEGFKQEDRSFYANLHAEHIEGAMRAFLLRQKEELFFFLELPAEIRRDMIDSASSEDGVFIPLRVHSVFRIFESLTQEDFAQIRSREGNQIDAINGYLKDIWAEMPDTPYDIMTFMVNQIVKNLGIGEGLRQAIWTIAAAPFGLREKDISHFAGDDWDDVQFYRAMNFLHDFFYEDRTRHTWRAKYITTFEDGLQDRQKLLRSGIIRSCLLLREPFPGLHPDDQTAGSILQKHHDGIRKEFQPVQSFPIALLIVCHRTAVKHQHMFPVIPHHQVLRIIPDLTKEVRDRDLLRRRVLLKTQDRIR